MSFHTLHEPGIPQITHPLVRLRFPRVPRHHLTRSYFRPCPTRRSQASLYASVRASFVASIRHAEHRERNSMTPTFPCATPGLITLLGFDIR